MMDETKVFFNAGDLVKVRHEIDYKPVMYVVEKVTRVISDKDGSKSSIFMGIKCRWFDKSSVLHEAIFSTKDLVHV